MKEGERPKDLVVSAILDRPKPEPFDGDLMLVERYLAGDQEAFEELYLRYYEKVFALAKGILLNVEDAADAVQEVFALVHRNLRRFNRRSRFGTWLFRVAVNRIIQHGRRLRANQRLVPLDERLPASRDEGVGESDPRVQSALSSLNPNDRAILALFYWEELSLQEIGESLGCGVNAAKTRLYRARERFRKAYEEAKD